METAGNTVIPARPGRTGRVWAVRPVCQIAVCFETKVWQSLKEHGLTFSSIALTTRSGIGDSYRCGGPRDGAALHPRDGREQPGCRLQPDTKVGGVAAEPLKTG